MCSWYLSPRELQSRRETKNLCAAEIALRGMSTPPLIDALDYLALLTEAKPEKLDAAAVRWPGPAFSRPTSRSRFVLSDASELLGFVEPGVGATDHLFAGRDSVREERLEELVAIDASMVRSIRGT